VNDPAAVLLVLMTGLASLSASQAVKSEAISNNGAINLNFFIMTSVFMINIRGSV
jgi:hypothetical protein